ncbi:protein translocase subunit SecD [Nesterenkonia xinjiangensis]|uniref:Protein translocase subunit SecD n=1 Tax=Nesterenkonia xinjiangensis TaxID=225327 RepID=A0A7Z0GPB4_9MICC|nr:protein translocase subunit SecD [Nesterenkonia xinjiangensis]NYJ79589.1 preprotein translocase subunit SecD [Nesterenkonia xinjiangensis]
MAKSTPVARARAALIGLLVLILGMGGLLAYGVSQDRAQWAPLLALDLSGGTQMVLSPHVDGDEQLDSEQLEQAVEIIRQRVDGSGVSEAEIATQGAENVVVGMPGTPDPETRELIQASADMEFRPVLQAEMDPTYVDQLVEEGLSEEEAEELEEAAEAQEEVAEDEIPEGETAQPEDFPEPTADPENPSDPNWITQEVAADFANFSCSREVSIEEHQAAESDAPMVTCDPETGMKYVLGPVEVPGTHLSDASFGMEQTQTGQQTGRWVVNLVLDREGTEEFAESSSRLYGLEGARNQFAIVMDSRVISAPRMNSPITDGRAEISGSFSEEEARGLSEQLRYGSLPVTFEIQSEEQISATLGSDQLRMGLLAGIIGLVLVAGYALFQYRALGLVTISSLAVVGLLTWWAIGLLGWSDGYRLSLAGIAGLIVSIGLTADSFIVYFERVKDELREGRSLAGAVESGWARARRTILASKAVNVIAAVVLYMVAVGNVRGFAFTLGLTAILDVILVFLFTHPVMQMLARRKFFAAGRRFSGLSERELGVDVLYRGAGRFARREIVSAEAVPSSAGSPPEVSAAVTDSSSALAPGARDTGSSVAPPGHDGDESDEADEPRPVQTAEADGTDPAEPEGSAPDAEGEGADLATMTIAERRRARARRARQSAGTTAQTATSPSRTDTDEEAR